jgi:hypothetical protein
MTAEIDRAPVFLAVPEVDALIQVAAELTAQLWTVKRRLQLVEQQLIDQGQPPLDAMPIDDELAAQSAVAANDFVASVFRAFTLTPQTHSDASTP